MAQVTNSNRPQTAPLISVLIPFKNEAPTLPLVLDSLLIQETNFDFEVIFADGCSTDSSVQVIREHQLGKRAQVQIIHLEPENSGMTHGWNRAAEMARGSLLLFMQSDIRIRDTQALNKVAAAFNAPDVVGTSFLELNADAEFQNFDFWGKVFHSQHIGIRNPEAFDEKFNAVRKDVFDRIGKFDVLRFAWGGEQMDMNARLLNEGRIKDAGVAVEHLHGWGKSFSAWGLLGKYCRNAEVMGATTSDYLNHPSLAPGFKLELIRRLLVCLIAFASLVPPLWPWSPLALVAMATLWKKKAFLLIRSWKLVWIPIFGVAAIYCFSYYFLKGWITGRTSFRFSNKM